MKIFLGIIISINILCALDTREDTKQGLVWQDTRDAQYIQKDWQGAVDFCEGLTLAEKSDWMLPTIKELETIDDITVFKYIGTSGYYWSATEHDTSKDFAWMMNFKRAYKYSNYKTYERYIRCVRSPIKGK
jgi:hypothetical protein